MIVADLSVALSWIWGNGGVRVSSVTRRDRDLPGDEARCALPVCVAGVRSRRACNQRSQPEAGGRWILCFSHTRIHDT